MTKYVDKISLLKFQAIAAFHISGISNYM